MHPLTTERGAPTIAAIGRGSTDSPVGWLDRLPLASLAHLGSVDARAVAEGIDLAGDQHPAPFVWRADEVRSAASLVGAILDGIEAAVVGLFPAWLPEAEGISTAAGSGEAVVRRAARSVGSASEHHGPYLADLASRALRSTRRSTAAPAEVRARGAPRAFATAYGRSSTVLIIELASLMPHEEHRLVDAASFLVRYGAVAVWLAGSPLRAVESIPVVETVLPGAGSESRDTEVPPVWYPPVVGRPHPASDAEQRLESALAEAPWASGRAWNQHHAPDPLVSPISLDLVWWDERLAVEIDGAEHRSPEKFENDRQRDVRLTLAGYTVVRFTNEYVLDDVDRVVSQLRQLVQTRRNPLSEGRKNE